ncbi:MAG: NAD(P)/FAD-dependent oxidoreductase [Bacteroidia bacterium]|nr:NAD(P)/FAD-dependent oxidoreductase [Bacteroidia bacterium]MDW8236337.1 NAD(P)/FAD-dependent oxidoreductase [Bacteroidia bacterium]
MADVAVAIIGAGPAGIACAWRLAQLGFSPLILEKATFPRDKVCGDALSGKSIAILKKLGGSALLEDFFSQPFVLPAERLSFWDDRKHKVSLSFPSQGGLPQGATAPRLYLDKWLWEQIPDPVTKLSGEKVVRVHKRASFWEIEGKSGLRVKARFIVGADGANSRVAPWVWRFHGLNRPVEAPAVRGYASSSEVYEELHLHFIPPLLPGYFWEFPLAHQRLNVGIGMPPPAPVKGLRPTLQALWPEPLEGVGGHKIPLAMGERPLSAQACALVGDAAALADPFTGEGIGNALLSGIRLAEALARVPMAQWWETDWETFYTKPLYRELRQEMRITRVLHRIARSPFRVRGLLALMQRMPFLTRPLLDWYGVKG